MRGFINFSAGHKHAVTALPCTRLACFECEHCQLVVCTGTEMTELMSVSCCLSRLISAVSRHDILQVIIPRLIAGPRPGTTDAGCRYRDGEEDGSRCQELIAATR